MDLVIARELEILGSHGMAAHDYPEMLALVAAGRLARATWSRPDRARRRAGRAGRDADGSPAGDDRDPAHGA